MESPPRARVLIAGGGVAALEAALTLRELGGPALDVTIVAPEEFHFRPLAAAEAFALGHVGTLSLETFARETGARHEPAAITRVDPTRRRVAFRTGEEREYDALLLAIGAHPVAAVPGASTWWDETDPRLVTDLVGRAREGRRRIVFVVTPGCGWPLPLYELALMLAHALPATAPERAELTIVTHEAAPLSLFGPRASAAVGAELEAAGIRLRTGVHVDPERSTDRALVTLPGGARVEADEVIALPRLEGPRLAGVPSNRLGFLRVDRHGRVVGVDGVWAAGDVTAFPIKQGGLAARQAEAAAMSIAAAVGLAVVPIPFDPVLRGTLLTREEPGEPNDPRDGVAWRRPLWWPPTRVAGRRLGPYLAARTDGPDGLPVEISLVADSAPGVLGEPIASPRFGSRAEPAPL
jgi:sulfide:quinone oxidoreductase